MKKILFISLAVLFVLSLATTSFASVSKLYEAAVVDVKGDVKVDPNADGGWFTPWIGMKLKEGALIKTGKDASAEIVFDAQGLNILKIASNSEITVKKSMVEMPEGSVLADFANLKEGSSFTVKTPTAACAIRGSGMGVDHINNMTVVMAFEDNVYVQGLDRNGNPVGKQVVIPEGWKSQVSAGKTEPPEELSENEQQIWNAWIEVVAPTDEDVQDKVDQVQGDLMDTDTDTDTKDLDSVKEEESESPVSPSE
ncbi:MAG: hypothetical protein GF409_05180 [Candidatus Omnitrophica bacterium]|nr:hypothetical protein [Candidatus Omnitrophota bacterium]